MPHGFQYQALSEPVVLPKYPDQWECREYGQIKRAGISIAAMALTASSFVAASIPGPARWECTQSAPPAIRRILQPHYGDVIRVVAVAPTVTVDMWLSPHVPLPKPKKLLLEGSSSDPILVTYTYTHTLAVTTPGFGGSLDASVGSGGNLDGSIGGGGNLGGGVGSGGQA